MSTKPEYHGFGDEQAKLLKRIRHGAMLTQNTLPYRPFFAVNGDKIHAKTPLSLIRRGVLVEDRKDVGITYYKES